LSTEAVEFKRPRKLTKDDDLAGFTCGNDELDVWFTQYAFVSHQSGMARVFVSTVEKQIAGFYALTTGGVEHSHAPERVTKGVPRHPVPVTVLTRMGVSKQFQRCGLGYGLLRDALVRVDAASDEVGIRALLIHAKNEEARDFYMSFAEFEPSPTDPLHLFLLMKDLRKSIAVG
jgi:hypothetical protein